MRYLLVLGSHEFDIAIALNVDLNPLLATCRCFGPQHRIRSLVIDFIHDKLLLRTVSPGKSGAYPSRLLMGVLEQSVFVLSSADHLSVGTEETLSVLDFFDLF